MAPTIAAPTVTKQKMYWYLMYYLVLNFPLSVVCELSQQIAQRMGVTTTPPKKLGISTPPVKLSVSYILVLLMSLGWMICVQKAATNPPKAPTVKHAEMLVYRAANCPTIAGPQNTETITDTILSLLNPLNKREKVMHEMIPVIQLQKTFKTPTLYRLANVLELSGLINTVDGMVQNTMVVPKIAITVDTLDGRVLVMDLSYFLFRKMLQTIPKNAAKVQMNVSPKSSNAFCGDGRSLQYTFRLQYSGMGQKMLQMISDMKLSNRPTLPIVARQDIRQEIVRAMVERYMITLMYTPVSYWYWTETSVLPDGVVRLNPPMKVSIQNFWINGDNWMFRHIANIVVARPRAAPRPQQLNINPTPTANSDIQKYIGSVRVSYTWEKS